MTEELEAIGQECARFNETMAIEGSPVRAVALQESGRRFVRLIDSSGDAAAFVDERTSTRAALRWLMAHREREIRKSMWGPEAGALYPWRIDYRGGGGGTVLAAAKYRPHGQ